MGRIVCVRRIGCKPLLYPFRKQSVSNSCLVLMRRTHHDRGMRNDLREARIAQKLSQAELAKKIGKDQAYVSRIESGSYKLDLDVAPALSKALRIPLMRVLYPKDAA